MESREQLIAHGIKPSMQRLAIMEYLQTHRTHPTADEIYEGIVCAIPTLSKTTVYNTLTLLSEAGAILSLDIDPKKRRFDGECRAHAHFLCTCCESLYDLPFYESQLHEEHIPTGFTCTETQIYHKGLCKACLEQQQTRTQNT